MTKNSFSARHLLLVSNVAQELPDVMIESNELSTLCDKLSDSQTELITTQDISQNSKSTTGLCVSYAAKC